MDEGAQSISGLKAKYFQHILGVGGKDSSSSTTAMAVSSPSSSDDNHKMRRNRRTAKRPTATDCTCQPRLECTCCVDYCCCCEYTSDGTTPGRTVEPLRPTPPPSPSPSPLPIPPYHTLAEEALGMLSPAEKDEMILEMHAKLRHLVGRVEEETAFSERRASDLERAHRDVLRGQMLSEQRLREELLQWRQYHPEVAELRQENARLRADNNHIRRQHMAVLGKLARRKKLLKTAF